MSLSAKRIVVPPVDPGVAVRARARIDALTKPLGSLGQLEALAERLCAIAGGIPPHVFERRAIIVGAADHGVTVEGVSAYPSEVTAQMVGAFLRGTAAISAFARAARAPLYVVDFGVGGELPAHPDLLSFRIGSGTANLAREPALSLDEVDRALQAGVEAYEAARGRAPFDVLALGEMGIGNTTAAAAVIAALTGAPARTVVGRGTGIDDERLERKIALVEAAVARCAGRDWRTVASEVGGYEIVGLAGVMLAAANERVAIVLDGFIVAAAALIAAEIAPAVADYCIAAHRSREPGHAVALGALRLRPLLDLDLRLGEASGAALALPLIEAAARMVREMQTFAEAGVSSESETVRP